MQRSVTIGREQERNRILDGLSDPGVRTLALRGAAGQGKTSLALDAARGVRGALVGYGKHTDDASGRGLRALGEALRALLEQSLEQLYDVEIGLASLRQALGASASALIMLDRDLFAGIVAETAPPLSAGAAVERLGLAVERLLGWMQGFKAPMILVLDDWGRAAPATEELYRRIAASDRHGATLVGTERDSEPSRLAVDVAVDLAPITTAGMQAIAASRLDGDEVAAAAVMDAFGEVLATPLQLTQSLAVLVGSGALVNACGAWRLDRGAAAAHLGAGAAAALVRRSGRASPDLRRVLEAIGVAGDGARADDVAAVSGVDRERLETAVEAPPAQGLVERIGGDLRIVHDTVRSAVLADLEPERRRGLADRWAARLAAAPDLVGARLDTALRLRLDGGLDAAQPGEWTSRFVAGARVARAAGAAEQARAYAAAALELEARAGTADFVVAQEAAQAALQAGDLDAGGAFARLMEARAQGEEERLLSAETALLCARLSGQAAEGLRLARAALATEGFRTPDRVSLPQMVSAIVRLRLTPDKPRPTHLRPDSALYRVLNTAGYMAFEQEPRAAVVLSARAASFAPLRGTAYAAGLRATLACLSGDWDGAIRWGRDALDRLERPEPLRAPALHLALQFGAGLELDAARTFAGCERLQALAVGEGDLGIAAYANRDRALSSLRLPVSLASHRRTLADCRAVAERFEDQATGPLIGALDQMAHNLAEGGPQPWRLRGDIFDSPRFEREADQETKRIATAFLLLEAMLANAFGAWETTVAVHGRMNGRFDDIRHHPWIAGWSFHTGLARARLGLPTPRWERFAVARHARVNPAFAHRHLALEAERRLRRGRVDEAMATYERAVMAAEASGFRLEAGLTATAAAAAARGAGRGDAAGRFDASRLAAAHGLGAAALVEPGAWDGRALRRPVQAAGRTPEPANAAERASRAKTRLLAEAAHELRTPMQGIQGLLDLAADDPAALDVSRVQDAFAGLRSVVDDLTDLGAVESERLSLVEAPFSPLRLVETETVLAGREAARRGRRLRLVPLGEAAATVCGDAGRTAQIVRNLLSNALRYGDGEVIVTLDVGRDRLAVEVADEGPGLSQADLTRLFQPFTRGDASGRAEGSGLGLALSRRLAERMAGELTGANRAEGGAVFRLELPVRAVGGPAAVAAARLRLRVLLAEDADLSRETMTRLLERQGHAVSAVGDGQAAVAAGLARDFDVLVLDARMPRLGGPEALAQLREAGCGTPALVVTAAPDAELAQRLHDLQPVRLVRKPLTCEQLCAFVEASAAPREPGGQPSVGEPTSADAAAELATRGAELRAACRSGDLPRVRELAHAAAGLAAQFGLVDPEARFGAVEAAAKRLDAGAVERALADLAPIVEPVDANGM